MSPRCDYHRYLLLRSYFFFFQAEDGIRDKLVTGVQTCALPIFLHRPPEADRHRRPRRSVHEEVRRADRRCSQGCGEGEEGSRRQEDSREEEGQLERSEERRVGKECRSRWSPNE